MLNKYREGIEREMAAADISAQVFNAFFRCELPDKLTQRRTATITKILQLYMSYIKSMENKEQMRKKTVYDYSSRIKILNEYIIDRNLEDLEIGRIDLSFFVDFLDYIFLDRINTSTTRNNYRTWCSAFCSWLVDRQYMDDNPISSIPILPEKKKFREALAKNHIIQLRDYLLSTDRRFLLACMFEYYEMIRPTELVQLRIRDISVKSMTIFISSSISKNRKDGLIALNINVAKLLIELGTLNAPSSFFVFGKDFLPSNVPARSDIFRKRFDEVRAALHFPLTYQFYSLKDSGIRDLINACGAVTAKEQARHSSIEVTNRYVVAKDGYVGEATKHFNGSL